MAVLGVSLWVAAWVYFFVWFDIDYGVSADEYLGFVALGLGALLMCWAYLDRERQRQAVEREQAWKDGTP